MNDTAHDVIVCSECGAGKPVSEFAPAQRKTPAQRSGNVMCLACRKVYIREYHKRPEVKEYARQYARDPENRKRQTERQREMNRKAGPARAWAYYIKHKYGITSAQYAAMVARQGGHCASCGGDPDSRGLAIDHDHKTGKVRELLCHPCNHGIGQFRDDPERMRLAAAYIERHK